MTASSAAHVKITVTMACGHVLTFTDTIEDKYPFWCEECDLDHREGKYPWKLTTEIVGTPKTPTDIAVEAVFNAGFERGVASVTDRTTDR